MVAIYNSFTRQKELFTPIEPNKIRMYVCGMTVYDFCHIGHARVMVIFDMVSRYLRSIGFDVLYIRNITDIDDKIIERAKSNNESITDLTNRFIEEMNKDANALGVNGTPSFFLISSWNEPDGSANQIHRIHGAQPYDIFKESFDSALKK